MFRAPKDEQPAAGRKEESKAVRTSRDVIYRRAVHGVNGPNERGKKTSPETNLSSLVSPWTCPSRTEEQSPEEKIQERRR